MDYLCSKEVNLSEAIYIYILVVYSFLLSPWWPFFFFAPRWPTSYFAFLFDSSRESKIVLFITKNSASRGKRMLCKSFCRLAKDLNLNLIFLLQTYQFERPYIFTCGILVLVLLNSFLFIFHLFLFLAFGATLWHLN